MNIENNMENEKMIENFESWNILLDIQIKPLRSKNARTIFQFFLKINSKKALTTLDIEKQLVEQGISLDKKEINGWLGSLLEAGLIFKEKTRGKPTTFQYFGKYSFDLWKITSLGQNIAHGLTNFAKENDISLRLNSKYLLRSIQSWNTDDINKIFQQINELDILSRILRLISNNSGQVRFSTIVDELRTPPEKIDEVISNYLEDSELNIFVRKTLPYGLKERFRNILGLSAGTTSYSLTEEGKRLAVLLSRSKT